MSPGPKGESPLWEGREGPHWARAWGVPRVVCFSRIDSTNDWIRRTPGLPFWTVVVADEQTAGRGRRERSWWASPADSVLLSVLLPATEGLRALPLRVGVGVARAIEATVAGLTCGLKWPNDVQIEGAKVAGVLCEGVRSGEVVVGVGINVAQSAHEFPQGLSRPAVSLGVAADALGVPRPPRSAVVRALVTELRRILVPAAPWIESWSARDVLRERRVRGSEGVEGLALGVDATGALRVRSDSGTERFVHSGSVEAMEMGTEGGQEVLGGEARCISS